MLHSHRYLIARKRILLYHHSQRPINGCTIRSSTVRITDRILMRALFKALAINKIRWMVRRTNRYDEMRRKSFRDIEGNVDMGIFG